MRGGCRRGDRGSVFLLAMVSLIALLLLGTSMLETAIQGLARSSNDRRQQEALCLAESGVDMAITKLYENYDSINQALATSGTYTDTFTLPQGSVTYTVTAPYAGIPDTCVIVSDSTTWTNREARVRVVAEYLTDVSRVFEGAIFSDSPLVLNGAGAVYPDADGTGGKIYANGDITFNGTSFDMTVDGGIYTTGTANWVPDDVPATSVHQGIAPVAMPIIDIAYYESIATATYTGNVRFDDADMVGLSGVIFVNGDVRISGNYSGQAVIVATGKISVTGNVTAVSPDVDALVLMSPMAIKIAGNSHVDGLIYAHSVVDEAETTISGSVEINGAIVSDVVRTNGAITVTYSDVWDSLPLPGIGKMQWAQVSWEHHKL